MTLRKIELGKRGEEIAVAYLKNLRYKIAERNFRISLGEIDIIAWDGDTLCFIEVKTRMTIEHGTPWEAVSRIKQRKLSQLALAYLKSRHLLKAKARFDIVAVTQNEHGQEEAQVLQDAFELSPEYSY